MEVKEIKSFKHYVEFTEALNYLGENIILFRGQSTNKALLPSIARSNPKLDTTNVEIKMLSEFRRTSHLLMNKQIDSDWDLLVYAQHFGLKTRLLDWSSNPMVALWFACQNEFKFQSDSYVYILSGNSSLLADINKSPFETTKTRILCPVLNSERILAQSGWFTAHKYSKNNKGFVKLETNEELKDSITQLVISATSKLDILKKLEVFGINNRTMYPDIHGLCEHLNWSYRNQLK
ncbi:FRG domain-containing protein [Mucilaginibacter sp. X4EP1]|uniref:FRG domain-containing protein n=1 Tax=Mucilaginibacter sp. X4EP1 TaxID=2723092 RepID=UPI0021671194|nr:FRG domain-containing protein [Mucilaginibacter sp. X4EP1]MCS3811613.1 hypothetical protein [Mucilaginibacter sp. X4EP1]